MMEMPTTNVLFVFADYMILLTISKLNRMKLPRKEKKAYRSFIDGVERGYTPTWTKRILKIYTSFVAFHRKYEND